MTGRKDCETEDRACSGAVNFTVRKISFEKTPALRRVMVTERTLLLDILASNLRSQLSFSREATLRRAPSDVRTMLELESVSNFCQSDSMTEERPPKKDSRKSESSSVAYTTRKFSFRNCPQRSILCIRRRRNLRKTCIARPVGTKRKAPHPPDVTRGGDPAVRGSCRSSIDYVTSIEIVSVLTG